ncbi:hypothetical protein EZ313_04940 [Ramlibacter henchirensis]|uniref:YCII-related domain-containing protein n=1 Tax=Ramlibacter henchirensis TaxID=204072 RepID=A0A4Z0C6J9_9BURK|nr:YciI family protein [Ramlibacter henchirensis]TFZ05998.1 hypothetical protein EZ313_04940 [Ramlibacter henchirensis]
MSVYLYRLIPPRPDFPAGMTPAEGAAMQSHFAYWTGQMNRGSVIVYGPVPDPKGTWGIAVLTVGDEAQARTICAGDPAVTANAGFSFELIAMPHAIVRGDTANAS